MTDFLAAVYTTTDDIHRWQGRTMLARLTGDHKAYVRGMRRVYGLYRLRDGLVERWAKGF